MKKETITYIFTFTILFLLLAFICFIGFKSEDANISGIIIEKQYEEGTIQFYFRLTGMINHMPVYTQYSEDIPEKYTIIYEFEFNGKIYSGEDEIEKEYWEDLNVGDEINVNINYSNIFNKYMINSHDPALYDIKNISNNN